MTSIKKRLVYQYLAIIFLTVIVLEGLFIYTAVNYYYGGIEQALMNKATVSSSFINRYAPSHSLSNKARYIFENIDKHEAALVEVLNLSGQVILNNSGFTAEKTLNTPEVKVALAGEIGEWRGKSELGERIIAVATPIWQDEEIVGVLRYTSSLVDVDKTARNILLFALLIGGLVFLLAWLISILLSRSVVTPIKNLTEVAEEMAWGNFQVKIPPLRHNDEIKKLADTLDYMASEIMKTDKIKNDFISSISHELRTPLTSIKGWTETILAGDMVDKEESLEGLKIVNRETDRLTLLVEELLDFSKYQSTTMTLEKRDVDVNELVRQAQAQLAIKAREKHIKVSVENKAKRTVVYGDYNRLMQVILNILDNAIKFTPPAGFINITITDENQSVKIIVKDTGIGMAPEDLQKIKSKFYQADLKSAGSGLGLAIAEEIINLHGGRLAIQSVLAQGSQVTVVLPMANRLSTTDR